MQSAPFDTHGTLVQKGKKKDLTGRARVRGTRAHVRAREGARYDTTIFAVRSVRFPRFGINVTSTVHEPLRTPFTLAPANAHERVPRTMESRIVPCEVFGITSDTWAAIARAVR